eukprot:TRINITY_DN61362_c0_g1_i1.p1 TRINITY_DN61362_c0_g1~~TRINITY_DN61362_c0_g1_i1.p1  ORF type:complete len:309 (-),score=35.46 TRINITY_DN61362_c0_g1_i1:160-1086(-)
MEKYRDWSDPGSGINPFVPLTKPRPVWHTIWGLTLGAVLAPVKMVLFGLLLLLLALLELIGILVYRLPLIGRFAERLAQLVLCRGMLALLGVWLVSTKRVGKKPFHLNPGETIVANYSSYADLLWIMANYSPIFALPASVDGDKLVPVSGLGALVRSLGHWIPPARSSTGIGMEQLISIARAQAKPIVIFPEIVRTNNTAVLALSASLCLACAKAPSLHGIALSYSKTRHSLPFSAGNSIIHMFHAMRQPLQTMSVKHVSPANMTLAGPDGLGRELATSVGVKLVQVKAQDKPSFLEFFNTGIKNSRK